MCGHHTGFICRGFPSPMRVAGERCHFDIKPPLLIFPRDYLLKSFPQGDIFAKQRWLEIIVLPLIDELPKAIEPQLPVYQSYRWQLGPNKWSLPMSKSLDHIVVTALRVGFPGESLGPATGGFACNCPVPAAWTMEASGHVTVVAVHEKPHHNNL